MCVSGQGRYKWHTSVLFTGTVKLLISTPCILLHAKIHLFISCPPYTQSYVLSLKKVGLVLIRYFILENYPHILQDPVI